MHRGFIKDWRKELDHPIWEMPPLYYKVWRYILKKCNWETKLSPTQKIPKMGIWFSPGLLQTSLKEVSENVQWVENNKLITPGKVTIRRILYWLKEHEMVSLACDAAGTVLLVENWHIYQPNNGGLGTHPDTTKESLRSTRIKTSTKTKENIYTPIFEKLWKKYPRKDGKKAALKHFTATVKTDEDCRSIETALDNYIARVERERREGFNSLRWKNGSTWFNNWKDDINFEKELSNQNPPPQVCAAPPSLEEFDTLEFSKNESRWYFKRNGVKVSIPHGTVMQLREKYKKEEQK